MDKYTVRLSVLNSARMEMLETMQEYMKRARGSHGDDKQTFTSYAHASSVMIDILDEHLTCPKS